MEYNCFPSYSLRDKLGGIFSKVSPLPSPFVYPLGRCCVCGCIGHGVAVSVGLDVRGALVIGLVVARGVVAGNGEALAGYWGFGGKDEGPCVLAAGLGMGEDVVGISRGRSRSKGFCWGAC